MTLLKGSFRDSQDCIIKSLFPFLCPATIEAYCISHSLFPLAGVDEAGRGPLAGPVVACACILPQNHDIIGLMDSKKLTAEKRERLYITLTHHKDVIYSVATVSHEEIDRINILQATMQAMRLAIMGLSSSPHCVLVDGNRVPSGVASSIPLFPVIKGDIYCPSISAASIIAKVVRDKIVDEYDILWPHYQFKRHKGYGTKLHIQCIQEFGPLPVHRKTFKPVQLAIQLANIA